MNECKMGLHRIFEAFDAVCGVCVYVHGRDSDTNVQRGEIFPNRKVSVEAAKLDVAFVSEMYRILELECYLRAKDSQTMRSAGIAPVAS